MRRVKEKTYRLLDVVVFMRKFARSVQILWKEQNADNKTESPKPSYSEWKLAYTDSYWRIEGLL